MRPRLLLGPEPRLGTELLRTSPRRSCGPELEPEQASPSGAGSGLGLHAGKPRCATGFWAAHSAHAQSLLPTWACGGKGASQLDRRSPPLWGPSRRSCRFTCRGAAPGSTVSARPPDCDGRSGGGSSLSLAGLAPRRCEAAIRLATAEPPIHSHSRAPNAGREPRSSPRAEGSGAGTECEEEFFRGYKVSVEPLRVSFFFWVCVFLLWIMMSSTKYQTI